MDTISGCGRSPDPSGSLDYSRHTQHLSRSSGADTHFAVVADEEARGKIRVEIKAVLTRADSSL